MGKLQLKCVRSGKLSFSNKRREDWKEFFKSTLSLFSYYEALKLFKTRKQGRLKLKTETKNQCKA